jgi:hypothetical protein
MNPYCQAGNCKPGDCQRQALNGGISCQEVHRRQVAADEERVASWATNEDVDVLLADVHDFAKFKSIENHLRDEIAELESGECRMLDHSQDVAATLAAIANATIAGAARLLASIGIKVDTPPEAADADLAQLEARLAAEKRAGAEAAAALEIVRKRLEKKRRLLKGLEGRRKRYRDDALTEVAFPLGPRLVRQIHDLSETYSLLGSLSSHMGYHEKFDPVMFPKPVWLDSIKLVPADKFMISIDGEHRSFWRSVESQLNADPKAKVKLPVKAA